MKDETNAPELSISNSELLLLVSLFVGELSLVMTPVAMHMKGERPFAVFFSSRPGMVFLCAMAILVMTSGIVVRQYLASLRSRFRHFMLIVIMNLITVTSVVGILEIIVRVGAQEHIAGEAFAKRLLHPKSWEATKRHYHHQMQQIEGDRDLSYIIYDDLMGWTVGPERRSANGLYFSNAEKLRTLGPEFSFPKTEDRADIALIGDSFTFGEEVKYEETWAYHLGQILGEQFQVLNYGVPGYSMGQAYLRYGKEARQRNPKVVIFGFTAHDFFRTMWVYPFLAIPEWSMPFSKPRFVLRDGELTQINVPPLSPDEIFSRESPSDLPFLTYQAGYRKSDWERSFLDHSYLFRLFLSIFPEWRSDHPHVINDELVSVNRALIQSFIRSATEAGSIPLVVYFPHKWDFLYPTKPSFAKRILQEAGIDFIDPSPCLRKVNKADRFLKYHYSPQGNTAVATCLHQALRKVLDQAAL